MSASAPHQIATDAQVELSRFRWAVQVHSNVMRSRLLADEHPELSLHLARVAAEAVCEYLAAEDGVAGERKGLDLLLGHLRRTKRLPADIEVSLRALQGWGNIGSHPHVGPSSASEALVKPCLAVLSYIHQWFVDRFGEGAPVESSARTDLRDRPCFSHNKRNDDGIVVRGIPGIDPEIVLPSDLTVQELVDTVWALAATWKPFSYGFDWWLTDADGRHLVHERTRLGKPAGTAVDDPRPLQEVALPPGSRLRVHQQDSKLGSVG